MPKKQISIFALISKYLNSIGIAQKDISTKILASKFEESCYKRPQAKSNIVTANKQGSGSNETHIAITKNAWNIFFSESDIQAYESDGDTRESVQPFTFFECNIHHLLARRASAQSTNPLLGKCDPVGTYKAASVAIIKGSATKWIDTNNGFTQIRLGKKTKDSSTFNDFRLGIQLNDYLIMLKHKYSDNILAICIPSEFCSKYNIISKFEINQKSKAEKKSKMILELQADNNYLLEADEDGTDEITVLKPQPAPKPKSGKNNIKYTAKPSIGRGALKKAKYLCENDPAHITFISKRSGHQYMEPHHLIPLSNQGLFENNIDISPNIISLCPTCHCKIHYGKKEDIKDMLQRFLSNRGNELSKCGIEMDIETLFALYNL